MGFPTPSAPIQATVTDLGRTYLARSFMGEIVFQAIGFSVGRYGYAMLDPTQVIPVDGTETALVDPVYPNSTGGTQPFDAIESPTVASRVYDCRLPASPVPSNADYGLGEIGIWATILKSNIPSEVGTTFLFSLAHMPIRAKTNRDVLLLRMVTNY
jgi:hypothetical protein